MSKFKRGDKVRVKDNPTRAGGDPSRLNLGDIVVVRDSEPDCDGDISVYAGIGNYSRRYIHEDCVELVETNPQDVHVGDRIRVYDKLSETVCEGVVKQIDDNRYVWIGKGSNIAYSQNYTESVEVTILERALKWPDHEGFVRITGGKFAGEMGLVHKDSVWERFIIRQSNGGYLTEDHAKNTDPVFDFEYVEG